MTTRREGGGGSGYLNKTYQLELELLDNIVEVHTKVGMVDLFYFFDVRDGFVPYTRNSVLQGEA